MASAGLRWPALNLLILFNFKARLKKKNPSANQKIAKHDEEELMLLTRRSAERLLLRNPPTDSGQSFLL